MSNLFVKIEVPILRLTACDMQCKCSADENAWRNKGKATIWFLLGFADGV